LIKQLRVIKLTWIVLLILLLHIPATWAAELKCTYDANLGEPFLMRLVSPYALSDVTITWLNRQVPLKVIYTNDRHEAWMLLGTDVREVKPGIYELIVKYYERERYWTLKHNVNVKSKSYPTQELRLPQAMVTPPKETLKRIQEEAKLVANAINTITNERYWKVPLTRPVNGAITSQYGLKRIYNGNPGSPHRGVDFRAAMGTPVHCVASGVVILVGDHYFGGKSIYVDHGNGIISCYMHLSNIGVKEAQYVEKGEIIGHSGQTGRATGPHLHFGLYLLGHAVDPMPLFQ